MLISNSICIALALAILWKTNIRSSLATLTYSQVALHLFVSSVFSMTLLSWVSGGIDSAMPQHFLGFAAITLIISYRFAIIASALVSLALIAMGKIPPILIGPTLLLGMLIPILIVHYWQLYVKTQSIWGFTIKVAMIGALLSFISKTLFMSGYYYWILQIPLSQIINNYIMLSPLFWLPEIMLNTTIILTLLQHKPHWVATYQRSDN